MAFDTICVKKIVDELQNTVLGSRIDKIYQPEKDEILLSIRTLSGPLRLVISASANNARVHFTEHTKENPKTPPMFCMLMRKHLSGGKIIGISQPNYERIIEIDIESYNELGDLTVKHLICEIMGRNSNIILCDENYKIFDSAKHVDFTVSSVRRIMPGSIYSNPPAQAGKVPILSPDAKNIQVDFSLSGQTAEKAIMSVFSGISPLTAREIVFDVCKNTSILCGELSQVQKDELNLHCGTFLENIRFDPCIIFDPNGKPLDFSAIPIKQYEHACDVKYFQTASEIIRRFYSERDMMERMKQKSADITKILHNNIERCAKKLIIQQKTMRDAENKEKYRIYGDLVTANLHRITPGMTKITVENYFEDGCPEIEIDLLPSLSPSKNAQRYYKLYSKLKNAEVEVEKQIRSATADIEYLESTLALVQNASSEADISAIRYELSETGYIKKQKNTRKNQRPDSKPMHFISSDGFDIYVGKNNLQNDYLTLRFANSMDMWFHTKKIHGSHTVIKLGLNKDIPESTMRQAAELAAYFSKARDSSQVPVDYTQIKNVKKPNGAKPGMVIYDKYNTVYVTPKLIVSEEVKRDI